jgi:hypothetical protein
MRNITLPPPQNKVRDIQSKTKQSLIFVTLRVQGLISDVDESFQL